MKKPTKIERASSADRPSTASIDKSTSQDCDGTYVFGRVEIDASVHSVLAWFDRECRLREVHRFLRLGNDVMKLVDIGVGIVVDATVITVRVAVVTAVREP